MIKIQRSDKSLKSANQPKLITFVVTNAIIMSILIIGLGETSVLLHDLGKGDTATLIRLLGFPAVASLALGVLSWLVPRSWKETLVFWRLGVRRLPSSEAFTKIAPADVRIDMTELSAHLGPLPTDYQKQSALWYATYRKHVKETAVNDANAAYLLYREMTVIAPVLLIVVAAMAFAAQGSWARIVVACLCVIAEYLLVMVAARNAGARLVANVLAIEGADKKPTAGKVPTKRSPRKKPLANGKEPPEA
jgi:hypothetical protein